MEYGNREAIKERSDHYLKHVSAMTGEGLHSKSDIAAELAHRDIIIDTQQSTIIDLEGKLETINQLLTEGYHGEAFEYDFQFVNVAHRVSAGGEVPRQVKAIREG